MTSEVQTTLRQQQQQQQRRARSELGNSRYSQVSGNHSSNMASKSQQAQVRRSSPKQATPEPLKAELESNQLVQSPCTPEEAGLEQGARQHHVGPVMGIFFKVWSLVKVTKVRQQQKMRRQNSDEAGQFQYISGDQLGGQPRSGPAYLEDAHFRRAGSQPAPSTSSRGRCEPLSGAAHRLQLALPAGSTAGSATNSTSSGVSSSAGSAQLRPATPGSAGRRAPSAHSLRRAAGGVSPKAAGKGAGSGWASKIRRSATTVNHSDLPTYASRYRRDGQERNHSVGVTSAPIAAHLDPRGSSSARSFDDHQSEVLALASDLEEDEEGSNDIYSTPNDSIQSVPSTAPLLALQQVIGGETPSACFPITKSFSTSNFGQLLDQRNGPSSKFEAIDETAAVVRDLQRQDSIQSRGEQRHSSRFFISSSSSEDSNSPNQAHHLQQQLLNQQKLRSQREDMSSESRQTSLQLEQVQRQVPVQHGVHYHNLALMRPDSLLCAPPDSNFMLPLSLFTPGALAAMSPMDSCNSAARLAYLRPSYRKSPSLLEISNRARPPSARLGGRYPSASAARRTPRPSVSSFKPALPVAPPSDSNENLSRSRCSVPNSISLQDCKLTSHQSRLPDSPRTLLTANYEEQQDVNSEYKLAEMLLESGSNPNAKDSDGYTVLMHAVLSDNVPAIKCLLGHHADPNDTNNAGATALDLICSKPATSVRLEILKLLIDNKADVDKTREEDNSRLLDRLIEQHHRLTDKLPYIDCLLQNGAKLGSSTWVAAAGKEEVQIRLLRKLCQDGYFLYKRSSIEAAVYRFEYALKRLAQLEQQLAGNSCLGAIPMSNGSSTHLAARQIKYQTYLGLSRCERKRKFFKRAIEFAHMAILVDSTSYEGYYSKAHILKDLGEIDDSIIAIDQTSRLVEKSIEDINMDLKFLQQEEALLFENCYNPFDQQQQQNQQQQPSSWIESNRLELISNLEYMQDAMKYISRLKAEILDQKLRESSQSQTFSLDPIAA